LKTIDLHFIDILHNSIRAKATKIIISIEDNFEKNIFSIKIIDNGCGIDEETLNSITNTFYSSRKERKIGMGIALLKYHSELTGGNFEIKSELGKGTEISALFVPNNIDMQPLGDLADVFANFICQYNDIEFELSYNLDNELFELTTSDIKEVFEGIELNNFEIIQNLKELIKSNICRN
jgi:signal transduction histidine kinase